MGRLASVRLEQDGQRARITLDFGADVGSIAVYLSAEEVEQFAGAFSQLRAAFRLQKCAPEISVAVDAVAAIDCAWSLDDRRPH